MSTTSSSTSGRSVDVRTQSNRRLSTETKAAFKTTEFIAYLGSVIAVLIAAQVIGDNSSAKQARTSRHRRSPRRTAPEVLAV